MAIMRRIPTLRAMPINERQSITSEENEPDENEPDENEKDEDESPEGKGKKPQPLEDPIGKGKGGKGKGKIGPQVSSIPPPPPPQSSGPPPPPSAPFQAPPSPPPPPPPPPPPSTPSSTLEAVSKPEVSSSVFSFVPTGAFTQTSFITITQSAKGKGEEAQSSYVQTPRITPPVSTADGPTVIITAAPVFVTVIPSVGTPVTSTMFAMSTFVIVSSSPLPQPSTNIAKAQTNNNGLAPGAKNLLIALGALGGFSLLVAFVIILLRQRGKKQLPTSYPEENLDRKFTSTPQVEGGLTEHPTQRNSSIGHESIFYTPKGMRKGQTGVVTNITAGNDAPSINEKPTELPATRIGSFFVRERSFSAALSSFITKTRRSSYDYKLGP